MNALSIGDLAQGFVGRSRSVEIKTRIATLTSELSTGRVQDVRTRIGSDFSYLAAISRDLTTLDAYDLVSREAEVFLTQKQAALSGLEGIMSDASSLLSSTLLSPTNRALDLAGKQAKAFLETATAFLNGTTAGRQIFSGAATDSVSVSPAENLLNSILAEVSGLATTSDIVTAVDNWFEDPAGYLATHYGGSSQTLGAFQVADNVSLRSDISAADPALRDVLRNLALIVVSTDPGLSLSNVTQTGLMDAARSGALQTSDDLVALQAETGFTQSRLDQARTRNEAQRMGMELALNSIQKADPYETAIKLEEAQFQLESLFAVTARSARLSLLNHI